MSAETLYRRPLPAGQIAFASPDGRALFREALLDGALEGWFRLGEQFHTQAEPAWCGLGTLVMALNALGIDPGRLWKGPWRWYSEELLDCCVPLSDVRERGLTLDELACLARCNGARASLHRPDDAGASPDLLREALRAASTASDGPIVVASYARGGLGQTGGGHYSPLGALHAARDLVLVMDVARFKYPPHWVGLEALFEAMRPRDPDTGRSRGWIVLERGTTPSALAFALSCPAGLGWRDLVAMLHERAPEAVRAVAPHDLAGAVAAYLQVAGALRGLVVRREPVDAAHRERQQSLLATLHAAELAALVETAAAASGVDAEVAAVLVLLAPRPVLDALEPAVATAWRALIAELETRSPALHTELARLREQLEALRGAVETRA